MVTISEPNRDFKTNVNVFHVNIFNLKNEAFSYTNTNTNTHFFQY